VAAESFDVGDVERARARDDHAGFRRVGSVRAGCGDPERSDGGCDRDRKRTPQSAHGSMRGGSVRACLHAPIIGGAVKGLNAREPHSTSDRDWLHEPRHHPRLAAGELHVWRVDLTSVPDELLATLSADEHERAERMLSRTKARLWARSRGALRALLGRYLDADPRELRFQIGDHGKPSLAPVDGSLGARRPVSFSISHSADLALYAFSASGAVGVDVERLRRPMDAVALTRNRFGVREAAAVGRLDDPARRVEFLRRWTRHEAELKCAGTGFAGATRAGGRTVWISALELGASAVGAVAMAAPPRALCQWRYAGLFF
jgi:4'-phosphopantetheinyl transferase